MEATRIGNPKRIDGLITSENEGTLVLAAPETGKTVITNRVGSAIIDLADGSRSLDSIVDALSSQYPEEERTKISHHVEVFIEDGIKKGIVDWPQPEDELAAKTRPRAVEFRQDLSAQGGESRDETRERERKFKPDVYWYLTFRCNLACAHCSVQSSPYVDTSDDLDTEGCLRVIDQMAELQVGGALLSGGEVLIRPDALTILRALGEKGIFTGLETNGLRIDKTFAKLAKELQDKGLLSMTISLDGGTAETHEILRGPRSFHRTVRGLRLLKEHGVRFDVQCVLNSANYQTIPQLYDLAVELSPECSGVLWSTLNAAGRGAELLQRIGLQYRHVPEIFEMIQENKPRFPGINLIKMPPAMVPPKYLLTVYKGQDVGCSTSCQFPLLGVLPNGDISVCALSRTSPELNFGNVLDTTLKEAWQKARLDMLRAKYVTGEHLRGICADCVWKRSCKGSCRAWAYSEGEDFYSPYPVCQDAADQGFFPDEYRLSRQGETSSALPVLDSGGCALIEAPRPGVAAQAS